MRISAAMQAGFIDEMEKLAAKDPSWRTEARARGFLKGKEKKSALMQNVGNAIKSTGNYLAHHAGDVANKAGETVKAFANPIKATKAGFNFSVKQAPGVSTGMHALGLAGMGLQGLQVIKDVKGIKNREDAAGRGRGERLGNIIGSTAGGFIGAPHGFTGGIVGSELARRTLGGVGKGVDRAVSAIRRKPVPAALPQVEGTAPEVRYG